jgi:Mrp family chromosome partitioning ATPase
LKVDDIANRLNPAAVRSLLQTAAQLADLVVINSPPFAFAESAVLAANVDGVLLAVELNRTRSDHALTVMEQLYLSRAAPVGVVIA